jgi:hypothetical protein
VSVDTLYFGLDTFNFPTAALSAPNKVTLSVADAANGGAYTATIGNSTAGAENRLYAAKRRSSVGEEEWEQIGTRTGSGTIAGTVESTGWWDFYVRSFVSGGNNASDIATVAITDGETQALYDRILEAVANKLRLLPALSGLAGVWLHKFPRAGLVTGPALVVTYYGEAETHDSGDRAADEIEYPVLIFLDSPTLVEQETQGRELRWREVVTNALRYQRLTSVPEVVTCNPDPRPAAEQGAEQLNRGPADVANRLRSGIVFRFVARAARGV